MKLILAGVAKDQEAFGRASAESNRQEDNGQQTQRMPHDARHTGGPGGGGPILHASPTGHGHSRPVAVNISLRKGLPGNYAAIVVAAPTAPLPCTAGADGGTWTRPGVPPRAFKSLASTVSPRPRSGRQSTEDAGRIKDSRATGSRPFKVLSALGRRLPSVYPLSMRPHTLSQSSPLASVTRPSRSKNLLGSWKI